MTPTAPLKQACVPGMALNSRGESPLTRYSQSRRLAKGQGCCHEAGSEGSPTFLKQHWPKIRQ
ncbi:hypothetical protein E1189_01720 [Sansalvadorimonas verongulae]|nr:hypothetical protein [Sansalvadorimonas verongulae]